MASMTWIKGRNLMNVWTTMGKNVFFWCVLFALCLHVFIKRTLRIESTLKLRVSEWARTLSNKESLCFFWGEQKVWFYYLTTSLHSLLAGVAKITRWSNLICHTDVKEDDESHVTQTGWCEHLRLGWKSKQGKRKHEVLLCLSFWSPFTLLHG